MWRAEVSRVQNFEARCKRGVKQTIIDVEKGLLPIRELKKIGKGGSVHRLLGSFCWSGRGKTFQITQEHIESILESLREQIITDTSTT